MKILADASLLGLKAAFPAPFKLTTYQEACEIPALLNNQDVLLCRSTLKVGAELLNDHALKYVATASSGTDHIDHAFLKAKHIQLIDAKGSNANSVAEYVLATLAYLDEQGLLQGNRVGIIGMGCVGSAVYEHLQAKQFKLWTYDPLKADKQPGFQSCKPKDLWPSDVICLHAELHNNPPHATVNLLDAPFFKQLKPGCVLINAARGGLVNEEALLESQKDLIYCTDVYLNEPNPNPKIIEKATLCTPHIAGHSLEAKYAAVAYVSKKLHQIAHLPLPTYEKPSPLQFIHHPPHISWQKRVLAQYNPAIETQLMKQAQDKQSAFQQLRSNHQRHEFS